MKPTIILYVLLSSIFTAVFSTHLLAASEVVVSFDERKSLSITSGRLRQ
jgi:hypothetical protein